MANWAVFNSSIKNLNSSTYSLTEDGSVSAVHGTYYPQSSLVAGRQYTLSIRYRPIGPNPRGIQFVFGSSGANYMFAYAGSAGENLGSYSAGTWTTVQSFTVTSVGNGEYIATLTGTCPENTSAGSGSVYIYLFSMGVGTQYDGLNNGSGVEFQEVTSKTFYPLNTIPTGVPYCGLMQEGSIPSSGLSAFGWTITTSTPGSIMSVRLGATTKTTSSGTISFFGGMIVGTGTTNTTAGDTFVSPTPITGVFAPGNWNLQFGIRSNIATGSGQGQINFRVYASVNADGSSARELTTTTNSASVITPTTTTTFSIGTWAAPAVRLYNEYLFFRLEWKQTLGVISTYSSSFSQSESFIQTTNITPSYILNADTHLYRLGSPPGQPFRGEVLHLDGQQGGTTVLTSLLSNFQTPNQVRIWASHGVTTTETDKKWGTSLYFNGTSWLDTPPGPPTGGGTLLEIGYANNAGFTYAFNIKPTAGDGTLRYLMGVGSPTGANNSLSAWLDVNNKINFQIKPPGANTQTVTSTSTFPANGPWRFVTFSQYRGLGTEPITWSILMYVDGVQEGGTISWDSRPDIPINPYKFSLGRMGEYANNYFTGYIDEFWFGYNSATDIYGSIITAGKNAPIGDLSQVIFRKGKAFYANMGYYAITNKVIVSPTNMTSDNSPPYQVSMSSGLGAGYEGYLAFDGTASFCHSGTPLPWWIKIDLSSPQLVGYYKLTSRGDGVFHEWVDWILEGSNDNSNWTLCHTVVGEAGWIAGQTRSYQCDFWGTYRFWRWTVTKSTSGSAAAGTGYAEAAALELYSPVNSIATLASSHRLSAATGTYVYNSSAAAGNDQYTKALLHFDTDFSDSAKPSRIWNGTGVIVSTNTQKFGPASANFSANTVWIDTPVTSDFDVGSGDWTFDCWFNITGGDGTGRYIFGTASSPSAGNRAIEIYVTNTNLLRVLTSGNTNYPAIGVTPILAGSGWHHVEVNRSGSSLNIFLDGILEVSTGIFNTINNAASKYSIGRLGELTGNGWVGYLDEVRFSKGIARHTSNFTPPIIPYATPLGIATLQDSHRLIAANGNYSYTGKTVTFLSGKSLLASQGSYSIVTPSTILKRLIYSVAAANGVYSITGNPQILRYNRSPYTANGVYGITGSASSYRLGKAILANRGIYSTTGQASSLRAIRISLMSNENYTITGQAVALRSDRKTYAANSVYSIAGKTVTFYRNYVLGVPTGIYTMAGKSGTNILPAIKTNYVLSGKDVNARIGYRVLSNKGTYGLSGQNVTSRQTYALTAVKDSYLLTGTVALRAIRKLYALYSFYNFTHNPVVLRSEHKSYPVQANYSLFGRSATLRTAHILYPTVRSFTLIPNSAVLREGYELPAVNGSYAVTGKSITLRLDHRFKVVGVYAVSGQSSALTAKRTIYLSKGTYTQTGRITTRKLLMAATKGSYTVAGQATVIGRRIELKSTFASYNLSGRANSFQVRHRIILANGTYTQTRNAANLRTSYRVLTNRGNYGVVGNAVTLRVSHKLYASKGNYNYSGKNTGRVMTLNRGNFVLTGKAATLINRKRLLVSSQTFVITGNPVVLRSRRFAYANNRVFSLTGRAVILGRGYHTNVDYGILKLIGKPVSFIRKYASKVSQGTYGINKPNTLLTKGSALSGGYGVVGTPVTFIRSHKRIKMGARLEDGTPVAAVKQTIPLKRYAKLIDY